MRRTNFCASKSNISNDKIYKKNDHLEATESNTARKINKLKHLTTGNHKILANWEK